MGLKVDVIISNDLLTVVKDNVSKTLVVESTDGKVANCVDKIIMTITSAVDGGQPRVSVLRFWGHGITHYSNDTPYPHGNLLFGKDQKDREDLSVETFDKFKSSLEKLTPFFAQGARVELRGCSTARGDGKELMMDLAGLWNVEVQASENSQSLITVWDRPVYSAKPGLKAVGTTRGIDIND